MTSTRFRIAGALLAVSATLLALTACAPAAGPLSSPGATAKHHHKTKPTPTPTPTPAAMVQPASRYPFGCSDLISAAAVASIYTKPMSPIDSTEFARANLLPELPASEDLNALGALDCSWYDGSKITDTNQYMELQVMPVTLAEWDKYATGGAVQMTGGVSIDCESDAGANSCQYEAYVNGSRYTLSVNEMKPVPTGTTILPPAVKSIVTAINAKLNSSTVGPAPAPQAPSVTLPSAGTSMLTTAQTRTALAIPSKYGVDVDCTGETDGPWEIFEEAGLEVENNDSCEFGLPNNGADQGAYGLWQYIPAGAWAAKQMESDTPSEVQVADPALPAGDSLYEFTDSGGSLTGDLVIGGNLIEIELFPAQQLGNPKLTVSLPTAMLNLANAFETTIRA